MRSRFPTLAALISELLLCSLANLGAQTEPRRFAILVGINQFSDPGLVSLQKAQNDAEDIGRSIVRLGGYNSVTVMSGGLPYTDVNFPSKNKIIERVGTLAEIFRHDDQVLFIYNT